jgi:hypothetical protein
MNARFLRLCAIALFALPAAALAAPVVIVACGTIAQPGSYIVGKNLSATGNCLVVSSDFVTIDLDGFVITGPGKGGMGIVEQVNGKAEGLRGIVIRNGTVTGFGEGIYFPLSTGVTIEHVSASFNTNNGMNLGQRALVTGSRADENGGLGFIVSIGSSLIGNTAGRNKASGFNAAEGAIVVNNEARNNGADGIFMDCPGAAVSNTAGNNLGINLDQLNGSCISANNSTL